MSDNNEPVLSDTEQQIFKAIENNDVVLLKTLLSQTKNVNIVDENSMTPLQHAAYKGNKDLVQILLDQRQIKEEIAGQIVGIKNQLKSKQLYER